MDNTTIEVEETVNFRPLSQAADDLNNEVLTPAYFLVGKKLTSLSLMEVLEVTSPTRFDRSC